MDKEKLFGEELDPELKEELMHLLSTWMTRLSKKQQTENPKREEEFNACVDAWEEMMKNTYPELAGKNKEFFDWLIGYYGEELETYYLFGLHDGLCILQWLMTL